MQEQVGSTPGERRTHQDRRQGGFESLYDRLDGVLSKLEDRRQAPDRRRRSVRRKVSLTELDELARQVLAEEGSSVEFAGLTGADGSTSYVELLLVVRGCHAEPCRITVGVDRTLPRGELRAALQRGIRLHFAARPH
jgi:hypothetical protein